MNPLPPLTEPTSPPRPRRLTATLAEDDDSMAVSMRDGRLGTTAFLALWLAGWTVGCVLLAREALTKREPFMVLFGVPFWASWLFVAVSLVNTLFGRRRVWLDPAGLAYERRLPAATTRRVIPLKELRGIESRVFDVDSDNGVTSGIEIRSLGRSIAFGTELPSLERDWLADRLDRHRRQLQAGLDETPEPDLADCRGCRPPSDCAWSLEDDFDGPHFVQRGRFDGAVALGMLFIAMFWNGIVGVFVAVLAGLAPMDTAPHGAAWWGLFVFLIPFEAVGLTLVVGLLAAVVEPFRVTRWGFGRDSVARTTTRAGLPLAWNRRYRHDGLATASVRDEPPRRGSFRAARGEPTGAHNGLLVADEANVEVCTIPGLTLGEARWMKGRLQAAGLVR